MIRTVRSIVLPIGVLLCLGLVRPAEAEHEQPLFIASEASMQLLEEGRDGLRNFRLLEAERLFRKLAQRPDGRVAAYLHLSQASLLKGLVTDDEAYFEAFFIRSDSLRELLKGVPASSWRTYLEAEADLQRAIASAELDDHIRSALAGKSAYEKFKAVLEAEPDFYEAYKGMGVLHITLASLPSGYRWLLKIFGYEGSVEKGIAELRLAAEQSRFNREEALICLAVTEVLLFNDAQAGVDLLRPLAEGHSESWLFTYLYSFMLLSNRQVEEAEHLLAALAPQHTDPEHFFIHYIDFYYAETLFKLDRFREAERFYRRFLARHRGTALRATTYYRLGLCLEMQEHRDDALWYYEQVKAARTSDSDRAAERAAKERLAVPVTARQRQLLLASNAYEAGRYQRAEGMLREVYDDPEVLSSERGMASYLLGRVYHATGQLDDAMRAYQEAVWHPGDPEARWAAWGQFYIGEIHAQRGEMQQATAAYKAALNYGGSHDYQMWLEEIANAALDRLKHQS